MIIFFHFYFICIGGQYIDYIVTLNKENGNIDLTSYIPFSFYDKVSIGSMVLKSRSYLRLGGGINHAIIAWIKRLYQKYKLYLKNNKANNLNISTKFT